MYLSLERDYLAEYLALVAARDYMGAAGAFRVISYNVLADCCLAENLSLYSYCPSECLDLSRRFRFISAELKLLAPTILCLQEVDQGFTHYFKAVKNSQWMYKKRSQASKRDGVAIVFDSDVFESVFQAEVEYFSPSIRRLDRPNVGLVMLLRYKPDPSKAVLVGNTHLLFNFKRGDIQLSQLLLFFASVQDCLSHYSSQYDISLVLAGDFNFTPSSPLYKFVTERELDLSMVPIFNMADRNACDTRLLGVGPELTERGLRRYQYQAKYRYQGDIQLGKELSCLWVELKEENGVFKYIPGIWEAEQSPVLKVSLPLQSAYVAATQQECFPSGYLDAVLSTTDYIWFSGPLQVTGVLLPHPLSQLLEVPSMPSPHYPSDHISLMADFAWPLPT